MHEPETHQLTQLLAAWSDGEEEALAKLAPLVHAELYRLAKRYMSRERPDHLLQTSALINEAYVRLIDWKAVRWQNRAHFFAVSAQIMRRILVDFARERNNLKRGGGARQVSLDEALVVSPERDTDVLALDEALERLAARLDPNADLPYPLRIGVLDHGLINAMAVPGGRIVVFRGLLEAADNPEEVAGVLAHEIGHVVHHDPTQMALRAAGTAGILGLILGDVFGGSIVAVATDAVLNASYQRDAEIRADETAYGILAGAKLPSGPFAGFFAKMKRKYGDNDGIMKLIASHPGLDGRAQRAAAADAIGDSPYEPALDDQDWIALRGICQGGMPSVRRRGQLN